MPCLPIRCLADVWRLAFVGRWLAATDSLGRVLLLEPRSLVCITIFKGYRDAQIAWAYAPPRTPADGGGGDASNGAGGGADGGDGAGGASVASTAQGALLLIYAPRRGLLEAWRIPNRQRVFACNAGHDCLLLSPPAGTPSMSRSSRVGSTCYLVQPSGVINVVRFEAPKTSLPVQ